MSAYVQVSLVRQDGSPEVLFVTVSDAPGQSVAKWEAMTPDEVVYPRGIVGFTAQLVGKVECALPHKKAKHARHCTVRSCDRDECEQPV